MKLSARNQLRGKVVEVSKGKTTAHVRVEVLRRPSRHLIDKQ